jgi:hypothetical protein
MYDKRKEKNIINQSNLDHERFYTTNINIELRVRGEVGGPIHATFSFVYL